MNDPDAIKFVERFANVCNITLPLWSLSDKGGELFLTIHVGKMNQIYTDALSSVRAELDSNIYSDRVFLKPISPKTWLNSIEVQLLQRILSESLTIGKATLDSAFHRKFIPFLGGEERRIYSEANHVVYGRRGAGKSSLVLYACYQAQREKRPYAWIALQQYRGRKDLIVIPQVLFEIVESVARFPGIEQEHVQRLRKLLYSLEQQGRKLKKRDINQMLPVFARDFLPFVRANRYFYLFLDDLHLLHPSIQPYFLSSLYSLARGNNVYLKITSIENLTVLVDEQQREGLQTPGDAQVIRLDYNLVNPGNALGHLKLILNSYINYVGVPSMASIAGDGVLERLVWVSAGVPRDALYIFNNAITKAIAAGRKHVAIMDINMAAADSLIEKEKYLSDDAADEATRIDAIVSDIRDYCLKEIKCNAFLVRLHSPDERYRLIKKVSDLRFIHIIHPGITPESAGEKYEAYMLDYAFYTGFRKAPSVKEFMSTPVQPLAKDIRKLKRYNYSQRAAFK